MIGAHEFAHRDLESLPAVARNLARLAELLRDPSVWGLAADHARVLSQPGRDETLEQVARLAEEAEDTLLVYYAGHGFVHDVSNELYLALPRTNPGRLYSALRYQDIRELLLSRHSRARRKVVILDCCWSGLALRGAMSATSLGPKANIKGTFVLTATSETRTALAPPGETYTAFTGELIQALEDGIPDAPPLLTMQTLYEHLHDSLVAKSRPTPQQRNGDTAGSIAVARNRYRPPVVVTPPTADPPLSKGRRRRRTITAVSALLVAALGSLPVILNLTLGGSSGDQGPKIRVKIGVSAPLSGEFGELGQGIKNSAGLAVKKANDEGYVDGVTFQIESLDDKAEPSTGQQNAATLVADRSVVGVVGPLNSGVAQDMQQVFHDARLTEVSPSNTNPDLTLGTRWSDGAKSRPFDTYFRIASNDMVQAPAAARYLYGSDKRRKAFVVDDKQIYGSALAQMFTNSFRAEGGKVVGTSHVNIGDKDFGAMVGKAQQSGADVVYYGGEYEEAAALSKQLHGANPGIRLAGGDGIFDTEYAKLAGEGAEGDISTTPGVPLESLASGKSFISDYKKAGYKMPYGVYGGYAYDATWALIRAFKLGVRLNSAHELPSTARKDLLAAMPYVNFKGATGRVAFDDYGDELTQTVTVYRLNNGSWEAVPAG
ncbi:hypothetical protein GCM10022403_073810 [Streptomyces coacervatus]|uniref:ABC transporter substrate-binding protein n=1 Tax=Streptomyces coacervatus TaxID=647381 RepID=A0ABP7IYR6_9ACTN